MANQTSPHILNTAANLLGFCLFVVTSFTITNRSAASIIDNVTGIIALLLALSCMLSFISIRTSRPERQERTETLAEYLFFTAICGIIVIISLLILNVIH